MKHLNVKMAVILLLVIPVFMQAQMTAQQVTKSVQKAYHQQIQGIDDITKKTNQGITYQKWIRKSGETIHKFRKEEDVNGKKQITIYDGQYYWTKNPYTQEVTRKEIEGNPEVFYQYLNLFDFAYAGKTTVNGKKCHTLKAEDIPLDEITNPTTGEKMIPPDAEGMDDATVDATLYIDRKNWVLVKGIFDAKGLQMQGRKRGGKSVMINKNFKKVKGLVIPYHSEYTMTIDMTAEEKQKMKEARKSMKEMKEKMKNMSPAKREMMKEYMKPKMEKAQSMMMNGEIHREIKVEQIEVNTGLSDQLFDGSKL